VTEVVEIQEEGTRAQAATVIAGACTAHVERMAQERVILLVTTHGEVGEAAQRVSTLYVELRMRPRSLAAKTAVVERRSVAAEEWCKRLIHELTLLSLRCSELCMTITSAPT
jgi:hypothetical protein